MNHPTLASIKTCTGCMACVDICPTGALKEEFNDEGHLYYKCDTSKCILCHQCERVCPVLTNFPYKFDGDSKFFAAWCKDNDTRKRSSSGGAFAAMATYILKRGGYVVGAANEGVCDIRHVVISDISELSKLQGSKYTQSDATGSYKDTFKLLKAGNIVLFSGTGCQVAGLLSFLNKKKYTGKLITVDLVCGGVPSHLLIDKFLYNEPYEIKRIVTFRTKETGWKSTGFVYNMKVEDVKGNIHDYTGIRNLITDGFSYEMTNRYSCYDCHFNGSHRKSDFTLGDLWGDEDYKEQHYNGLSLIIAHNEKAISFLHEISSLLHIEPTDKARAIKYNYRITCGKNIRDKTFERKHLKWMFSHLGYGCLNHIYANKNPVSSPWILYRIFNRVRVEILKKINKC